MIFDRHANLRYKYGNRHFWCRGYYVDTVGRNEKAIQEYVRNQLQEDVAADQISLKEFTDPFTLQRLSIEFVLCDEKLQCAGRWHIPFQQGPPA